MGSWKMRSVQKMQIVDSAGIVENKEPDRKQRKKQKN